jgi:hypothetical protein
MRISQEFVADFNDIVHSPAIATTQVLSLIVKRYAITPRGVSPETRLVISSLDTTHTSIADCGNCYESLVTRLSAYQSGYVPFELRLRLIGHGDITIMDS